MGRVVRITNTLRDSLDETLDKGNTTGKIRPYYYGIPYQTNKIILIPLRSNCPRSFSLFIQNLQGKKNHGLDFCKMIIIDRIELNSYTANVFVNSIVLNDLNKKRTQIENMAIQTINAYKTMLLKLNNKLDLTSDEIFLYQRSTLKNYINLL